VPASQAEDEASGSGTVQALLPVASGPGSV